MAHSIDVPFQPPKFKQVEYPPTQVGGEDISALDLTKQSDVFKAISRGIRNSRDDKRTGAPIQNKNRYTRVSDGWVLKAEKRGYLSTLTSKTIKMPDGTPLKPLQAVLSNDISGYIIVHLLWNDRVYFLCSDKTRIHIERMRLEFNPHRSPVSNGQVAVGPLSEPTPTSHVRVGVTIPVIHIDATELSHIGEEQAIDLIRAGVSGVKFIYQTDAINEETELPAGLLQQINYTLTIEQERAEGSMTKYLIPFLDSSYTAYANDIRALTDKSIQPDKVWYTGKLTTFQEDVYPIWQQIVDDFTKLKRMFLHAQIPPTRSGTSALTPGTAGFQFFVDAGLITPGVQFLTSDASIPSLETRLLNQYTIPGIAPTPIPLAESTTVAPIDSYTPVRITSTSLVTAPISTLTTRALSGTFTNIRTVNG